MTQCQTTHSSGRQNYPIPDGVVFLVEDDDAVRKGCEQALSLADIPVKGFDSAEAMFAVLPM